MAKFVIKGIEAVKGRQQFSQLVSVDKAVDTDKLQAEIYKAENTNRLIDENKLDGEKQEILPGVLDLYNDSIEKKYNSSFRGIITYMNLVADLQTVSPKKFKYLPTGKEKIKEFEFKNGDLRVYGIDVFGGKLIMYCGYKNQQPQDIEKFRSLKRQFLDTYNIKNIENEKRRIDKE